MGPKHRKTAKPSKKKYPSPLFSVYQPIVELGSPNTLGFEALTRGRGRWRRPEELFRSSYEDGNTIALDFACIKSSIKILSKLQKGEFLFVNVEPTTVTHAFVRGEQGDMLLKGIADHAHKVVFELTEGMKARDFELVKRGLFFMRKAGCQFAIDDVAGIDSKLIRLMDINPDYMKIDMGLINGLAENDLNQEIVQELIELAREHHCWMVAEGVERKKDLDLVKKMGIHYAQGYYFAKPSKNLRRKFSPYEPTR